ncbi:MAG: hypothetical protein J0L60_13545 [Ignavibacteria bacterium]|nr:hypothetical protein [Ignavibacteria bacterium]
MILYIPKNVDVYNTHLINLIKAYSKRNIRVIVGYDTFGYGTIIPDYIHFHMVEGLLRTLNYDLGLFFERMEYFKQNGSRFLYTAHDLYPHNKIENIDYKSFFIRFLDFIPLMIHHGDKSIQLHQQLYPNVNGKNHLVCHHGDYSADFTNFCEGKDDARKILEIPKNKKVILVFGQLQFKNVSFAKGVMKKLQKYSKDYFFIFAGVNPVTKYHGINELYYHLNNDYLNRIRINSMSIHKRFSNYEMFLLFKAADAIFLTHNNGLTSGIIPLSASLQKPFIYPNIGVFEEQALDTKSISYKCEDIQSAVDAIEDLLREDCSEFDNAKWLRQNSWDVHVGRILESPLFKTNEKLI